MMIIEVAAKQTHSLRRATLRDGIADAPVSHPDDDRPESFHLLARVDEEEVGVVSCAPVAVKEDGREAWRLYQMGVIDSVRGRGIGRLLVDTLVREVRKREGTIVWAMARDSAQGFYRSCGFEVIGEQYPGWNHLPHHTVIRVL